MTAKSSEPDCQPVSVSVSASARDNNATWTHLVQSSVPGLGFLFEVTGKPWTAWVGLLGLVFAATLAGLLGFGGGMHHRFENENENYYADFLGRSGTTTSTSGESNCPSSAAATEIIASDTFYSHFHPLCDSPSTCTSSSFTSTCANPLNILSSSLLSSSPAGTTMAAPGPSLDAALRVAREFDLPSDQLQRGVDEFLNQMAEGLEKNGTTLSQIPTYVTSVPNGTEKGLYLAVDLGGTNFRVCSINLKGDSTFDLTQNKVAIPRDMMVASSYKELFKFLAAQIEAFLEEHHNEHFEATVRRRRLTGTTDQYRREEIFDLGFTFSFPVHQTSINRGTLIRWTKGFDIPDAVGKDVCLMLQDAINELHLPVRVAALVNDTVGTLMARSYTSPGKTETLLGAIFGTGTNGAYVEKLDKVTKLDVKNDRTIDHTKNQMVINTEWGSFDNHLSVLPNTIYDQQLDAESVNPGIQMFEKRVSGMFLGEILRLAILALTKDSEAKLLQTDGNLIPSDSPLYEIWGIDTSFLSIIEADTTSDLTATKAALFEHFKVSNATTDDAQAIKAIGHAIAKRAARLSGIALAAILLDTKRIDTDETVDIGVDGSLVEFYPKFVDYMREAMREIKGIGEKESKVRIGIAKDGSGVGAALIALVAHKGYAISQP